MTDKDSLSGLKVKMPVRWPWDIKIVTSDGDDLLVLPMPCHSTGDKTLDDVMSGKCWDKKEDRENAAKWNSEQVRLARLISAAPELLQALEAMLEEVAGCYCTSEAQARAAIAKARGL